MRWKDLARIVLFGLALDCSALPAWANFRMNPSGPVFAFAIDAANQGTSLCAAASTECPAHVLINTAGAPIGVSGTPLFVQVAAGAAAIGSITANAGTNLNTSLLALESGGNLAQMITDFGAPGSAACATDTASCSLNQQMQRLAQRLTTVNTTLGTPFQAGAALAPNQSVNVAQFNGVTPLMGNGVTGTGSPRVTIASDNTPFAVNANAGANLNTSALATSANLTAGTMKSQIVDGSNNVIASTSNALNVNVNNANANGQAVMASSSPVALASNQSVADPCMFQAKTNVPISTASGTLALVTGVSAKKIYVCSLVLVSSGAISVSLSEGSGTTCGTSAQAGVIGVATNGTAANGLPLAANGGLTLGNGGGTVAATATNANYLCLFQSGTTQMAGNLTYVQQ
jgi:hypothetical protein